MSGIKAIDFERRTNADLFADLAALGYLPEPVIDLTHNEGKFWEKYRPERFVTNDLDPEMRTEYHVDARHTPFGDQAFATAVFDPPYKLEGTSRTPGMDRRYGLGIPRTRAEFTALLLDGTDEACRISSQYVIVKCQPQVNGGQVRWQPDDVATRGARAGFRKVTMMFLVGGRAQPETNRDGSKRRQVHPLNNYSVAVVMVREGSALGVFG